MLNPKSGAQEGQIPVQTTNGATFPFLGPLWALLVSYFIHALQSTNSEKDVCDGSNSYQKKHLLFRDLAYEIKAQES